VTPADWITALASAGFLGAIITIWQWHKSKFQPKLRARIDDKREGIELRIRNKGRAVGNVSRADVVQTDGVVVPGVTFEGFTGGTFRPLALAAQASMTIIIQAPPANFPAGVHLRVDVGKAKLKTVKPAGAGKGVGIYGLKSELPPGA
jgi:hypothetical protein